MEKIKGKSWCNSKCETYSVIKNQHVFFTSFLWKMPAARAADAFVFENTSEKCSETPAPLLAITGMLTASEIIFTRSISNPFP
jgi:hypothetical protein